MAKNKESQDLSLTQLPLFWIVLSGPILIGLFLIVFTLACSYTLDLSAAGFNRFLELSKFPVGIAALSIPLTTIVAVTHRSNQTKRQIELAIEASEFKNFYEHRKAFFEELDDHLEKEVVDISYGPYFYKTFFPDIIRHDYRAKIPASWKALHVFLVAHSGSELFGEPSGVGDNLAEALRDKNKLKILLDEKASLFFEFSRLLATAVDDVKGESSWHAFREVSSQEDIYYESKEIADGNKVLTRFLSKLSEFISKSFMAQFLDNDCLSIVKCFSWLNVSYLDSPPSDWFEFYLVPRDSEEMRYLTKEIRTSDVLGENEFSGRTIVLTFHFVEVM